ncbi:MAG: hypothetical protein RIS70_4214 [Planctomycetota bacterium]
MKTPRTPLDLSRLQVYPLAERLSMTRADEILIDPDSPPREISPENTALVKAAARAILSARQRDATVMLIYGAHLLRNGAARILDRMMERGWLTHLATNGAGTIHDWEYAWFGASTESVEMNVAQGRFGTWDETSTNIHVALMAGALHDLGYGRALGRLITEDGVDLPSAHELRAAIAANPDDPKTAARADLLKAINAHGLKTGRYAIPHRWKHASILSAAYRHDVPLTVHPGIGYDIIANHPLFSGSVIGRGAEIDFRWFGGAVEGLDGGVVLNVGSAIMGPQVFEKSLSCVNNLRLQSGRSIVQDHQIYVVDIQDGGNWDWTQGEPPKSNPAYYLRFCKSFARMGGGMNYVQCDNGRFIHQLLHELEQASAIPTA